MSDEQTDIEQQLEKISESSGEFLERGYYASTLRCNGELVRLAKAHHLVVPFINGTFFRMVRCLALLDPKQLKEKAISLIPFLEDEEHTRSFQADFDEGHYEFTRSWMTACVYENLADATGEVDGYNSDGMHQCVTDGLQVCRRTGKLECISCFRQYAADVYLASDDFTMARHQCDAVMSKEGGWSDRGDTRSDVCRKLCWINLLEGRVTDALKVAEDALRLSLAEGVNVKFPTRAEALTCLDEARIMAGQDRIDWDKPDSEGIVAGLPPEDEWPELAMEKERNDALDLCIRGEYDGAIDLLTKWDRTLDRNSCLAKWFEIRLRLIAAMHLSGRHERVERLAEQLRQRATAANDYLTIRRLNLLLDEETAVNPIASVAPLDAGPCATEVGPVPVAAEQPEPASDESAEEQDEADEADDELESVLEKANALLRRFFNSEDDDEAERDQVVTEYLMLTGDQLIAPQPSAALLHFAEPLNGEGKRAAEFWVWGQTFEKAFPDTAGVVCRVAALANTLRYSGGEETHDLIDGEFIENMFKRAMSLDRESVSAHWLAGEHYLSHEEHGEAERCLARACRLDRKFSRPALLLAEVYRQTDRPRDALAVLDMCLRDGCDDEGVAWEALVKAVSARQYESALTYADYHDKLKPEEGWVNYYRAIAHLELKHGEDVLRAIDAERQREDLPGTYHLDVLATCAFVLLDSNEEARAMFDQVLTTRVSSIEFMTQVGINNLLDMLWRHTAILESSDPHRQQLQSLLLSTCTMPDEFFDQQREAAGEQRGGEQPVNFYQVLIEQSLPEDWSESPGCFPGQGHWTNYRIVWGVLATDEEQAGALALEGQRQCADGPAKVLETAPQDEGFRDVSGIVWIGDRWSEADDEADDETDDEADE
jgi:tetratricopeptide (TPR) repeat protein